MQVQILKPKENIVQNELNMPGIRKLQSKSLVVSDAIETDKTGMEALFKFEGSY